MDGGDPVAGTFEGGQGQVERVVSESGAVLARKRVLFGAVGGDRIAELHGALTRRRHPALVRQRSVDVLDAAVVVVSDWVDGETLADWAPGASVDAIVDRIRQVAEAVDLLHADLDPDGPLLHRDVKPSNVIVTPDGRAVLIDPGLARRGPSLVTGSPFGTPGYVPPECIGDPTAGTPAADVWQLGITLVSSLLGRPPDWDVDPDALRDEISQRVRGEVDDPHAFAEATLVALAPDPADRPTSAAAWAASLRAAVGVGAGRGRSSRRGGRGHRRDVATGRRRWAAAAAIAGAAVVLLVTGVVVGRATGPDPEPSPAAVATAGLTRVDGVPAIVDTRTTSGVHVDQQIGAYLSTKALNHCRALGCEVRDSALVTGDRLTLTCRSRGAFVTNGNPASPLDDANPILAESYWWLGAVDDRGNAGFISEIWVHPDDRDAALPFC